MVFVYLKTLADLHNYTHTYLCFWKDNEDFNQT